MSKTTARLSNVQGNILITLDGADGTVADSMEVAAVLGNSVRAGIIPGPVTNVTGWQDTILVTLAEPCQGCSPLPAVEGLAAALTAVLGAVGIEANQDDSFERARRYDEHWTRFLETAEEEVRAALSPDA